MAIEIRMKHVKFVLQTKLYLVHNGILYTVVTRLPCRLSFTVSIVLLLLNDSRYQIFCDPDKVFK